jgi:tRNA 2-thiouridine synthesizing protein A
MHSSEPLGSVNEDGDHLQNLFRMSDPAPPILVDARGHRCPVPTLRLRRALEAAAPGQVVRLLADDPLARIDVPHFVRSERFALLSSAVEGDVLVFEVARA